MRILERIKKNKLLFFVLLTYVVMFIIAPDKAIKSVDNSLYYLLEMAQVLPVIFMLTVIIDAWIPKKVIIKRLGNESGLLGNLLSLLLGSLSAGPIYAAFPIGKMLLGKGASIANITIILSSWAVIKFPMLANEVKFLGLKFMIVRWTLTVIAIFIMAKIIGSLVKRKDLHIAKEEAISGDIVIIEDECIGCGICVKLLPEYYYIKNMKAVVKEKPVNTENIDGVKNSIEKCPAKAIYLKT